VNYRYHSFGQTADLRVRRNTARESAIIQREHGNPGGWLGTGLRICFKAKRQIQKLFMLGRCDLVTGSWKVRSHIREKTEFSSNSGVDKLPS
jgi:hypothetical protein